MEKTTFYVTSDAGKEVAGIRNPGAGEPLVLSEAQAAPPLRLRHISREKPVREGAAKFERLGRGRK